MKSVSMFFIIFIVVGLAQGTVAQNDDNNRSEFLNAEEQASYASGLPDLPEGARIGDIAFLGGSLVHTLALTTPCPTTRAYKMAPEGYLEQWPITCTANHVVLQSPPNDAHFVFINFPNRARAEQAPVEIAEARVATTLTGAAEVPGPGDADGAGRADIILDLLEREVCFDLQISGFSDLTGAHIHRGGINEAGPIEVPLGTPVDGSATGCTEDVELEVILAILRNPSGYYINVHNSEFRAGAVRGQLVRD